MMNQTKTNQRISKTAGLAGAFFGSGLVSLCCGVPLVLAALGIGGLGLGELVGAYHLYLTGGGILALLGGWYVFWLARKNENALALTHNACPDGVCEKNDRGAYKSMTLATLIVMFFTSLSLYSEFKTPPAFDQTARGAQLTFQVSGMTCASCAVHLERSLSRLKGVYNVNASAKTGRVTLDIDPRLLIRADLVAAIHKTGYKTR